MAVVLAEYDSLLTASEAARYAGVTTRTLIRWAEKGKLAQPKRTPGGHRRWPLADIKAAMSDNENR